MGLAEARRSWWTKGPSYTAIDLLTFQGAVGVRLGRHTGLTGGYRRTLIAYRWAAPQREKHILQVSVGMLGRCHGLWGHVTFHLLGL